MDVLNVHAEVEQGIKRKTSMVLTHVLLSTFMTTVPGEDRDSLPPILVLVGKSKPLGGGRKNIGLLFFIRREKLMNDKNHPLCVKRITIDNGISSGAL